MRNPKTHNPRAHTPGEIVDVILNRYNPCEFTVLFKDDTELSCDCHEGFWRCTWWFDDAYNNPRKQTFYARSTKGLAKYLEEKIGKKDVIEAVIDRDGEPVHVLSFT